MRKYTFTSESVTEGHPDKMADQVKRMVRDALLRRKKGGNLQQPHRLPLPSLCLRK